MQASPGGEADAGGLTTPAQRVEPPRASAKKPRPPPLDRATMEAPVSAFAQGPSPGPPSAAPTPGAAANGPSDAPISPLSGLLTGLGSGGLGGGAIGQVLPWSCERACTCQAACCQAGLTTVLYVLQHAARAPLWSSCGLGWSLHLCPCPW